LVRERTQVEVRVIRRIRGTAALIALLGLSFTTLSCNTKSNPVSADTAGDVIISIRPNSSQLGPNAYMPSPDTVAVGARVIWKNNDSMAHTATRSTDPFKWDTGEISPGAKSIVVVMTTPGTYSYACTFMMHSMTGIIVVK
jgi:manganese oxidase